MWVGCEAFPPVAAHYGLVWSPSRLADIRGGVVSDAWYHRLALDAPSSSDQRGMTLYAANQRRASLCVGDVTGRRGGGECGDIGITSSVTAYMHGHLRGAKCREMRLSAFQTRRTSGKCTRNLVVQGQTRWSSARDGDKGRWRVARDNWLSSVSPPKKVTF